MAELFIRNAHVVDWKELKESVKVELRFEKVFYSFTILLPIPENKEEEDTLDWFFKLDDEAKLAQLVFRHRDWLRDKRR